MRRTRDGDRRGGTRPNAGRPRKPGAVSHAARPYVAARFPQHVTLRIGAGLPSLARDHLMKVIRAAIASAHKPAFRVVELNVPWKRELLAVAPPTAPAGTWLLRVRWHGHGKLRFDEAPA